MIVDLEACSLSYIPERLHSGHKPDLPVFSLGERLFRRCKPEFVLDPFDRISLYDLSINREGDVNNPLSLKEDVLLNITPENGKGEKFDEEIVTLEIKELAKSKTYEKVIQQKGRDGANDIIAYSASLKLIHDKIPCNYSHSVFQISLNNVVVTSDNYSNTFGKKNSALSELRTKCKHELASMIIKGEVRINW